LQEGKRLKLEVSYISEKNLQRDVSATKKKLQTFTFIFHSSKFLFENHSYFKPSTREVMPNFHQPLGHTVSSLKAGASGCYLDQKK